jgi:hypothetical protein
MNMLIKVSHDPAINMRSELRDRVRQWVSDGIDRGLKCAEGGFCFDGIDYRVAYSPGDGGEVQGHRHVGARDSQGDRLAAAVGAVI